MAGDFQYGLSPFAANLFYVVRLVDNEIESNALHLEKLTHMLPVLVKGLKCRKVEVTRGVSVYEVLAMSDSDVAAGKYLVPGRFPEDCFVFGAPGPEA